MMFSLFYTVSCRRIFMFEIKMWQNTWVHILEFVQRELHRVVYLHTNVTLKCKKDDPRHENIYTVMGSSGYGHERRKDGIHGEHAILEEIGCDDVERRVSRKHVIVTIG